MTNLHGLQKVIESNSLDELNKLLLQDDSKEDLLPNNIPIILYSIKLGHFQLVLPLLKHEFPTGTCDLIGNFALYEASRKGQIEVVDLLLKYGANANQLCTSTNLFPLDVATNLEIQLLILTKSKGIISEMYNLLNPNPTEIFLETKKTIKNDPNKEKNKKENEIQNKIKLKPKFYVDGITFHHSILQMRFSKSKISTIEKILNGIKEKKIIASFAIWAYTGISLRGYSDKIEKVLLELYNKTLEKWSGPFPNLKDDLLDLYYDRNLKSQKMENSLIKIAVRSLDSKTKLGSFCVHYWLLYARCSQFQNQLNILEKNNNKIKKTILNLNSMNSIKAIIQFLYTDNFLNVTMDKVIAQETISIATNWKIFNLEKITQLLSKYLIEPKNKQKIASANLIIDGLCLLTEDYEKKIAEKELELFK
ncbi:ankyrin repeat domain-containing protein [Anaeramoeba flamelloides]|uniref:Ankyrin repeat domain-containing protein n=1 Tax=Anaeramoeba flamelloides TaxID=1746091 RepID=A0ABQ8XH65_9EUKA|nr:ankyrin repeat domain-containing protein [Anaeramoeba flamelloides]